MHAQGTWARAQAWAQEVGRSLWQVVRIRTFLVIVLQARPCMLTPMPGVSGGCKHRAGRGGWRLA